MPRSEEGGSHLDGLGAECHRSHDATSISDASGGDHGDLDPVDDPRDERERAGQGILSGAQERAAMATGFEARRHDRVDLQPPRSFEASSGVVAVPIVTMCFLRHSSRISRGGTP
jgi:hypothetical protein